jgi:hypothetical protein
MEPDTQMKELLHKLADDCAKYREAVDRVFTIDIDTPAAFRSWLLDCLTCTSQMYLDHLHVLRALTGFEADPAAPDDDLDRADYKFEHSLRKGLRERLASSTSWSHFHPDTPLAVKMGLRTTQDYINSFALHLPEVYEETHRLERCARATAISRSQLALAELEVSLKHAAHNHICFVQPAMQWAMNEDNWDD